MTTDTEMTDEKLEASAYEILYGKKNKEDEARFMDCLYRAVADDLIEELCAMAANDPTDGRDRHQSAFIGKATKDRTIEIGQWLHRRGGEDLMWEALHKVRDRAGGMRMQMLSCAWFG
jgi:hypothetical protein